MPRIVLYFLNRREVFLGGIEVVNCYLIHCNIHYWTVWSMWAMMLPLKIRLPNLIIRRIVAVGQATNTHHSVSTISLLLYFFVRLENWWEQTLVLHKRTIMVVCTSFCSNDVSSNAVWNIVFEITIKSLMLTIFNLEICKISSAMLSCKWAFFHVDGILVVASFFLFGLGVVSALVGRSSIILIHRTTTITNIIRNFAHAFGIYRHRFVRLLGHSEYLAHLRGGWGGRPFILRRLNSVFFS
jgi:hypothetical protein